MDTIQDQMEPVRVRFFNRGDTLSVTTPRLPSLRGLDKLAAEDHPHIDPAVIAAVSSGGPA